MIFVEELYGGWLAVGLQIYRKSWIDQQQKVPGSTLYLGIKLSSCGWGWRYISLGTNWTWEIKFRRIPWMSGRRTWRKPEKPFPFPERGRGSVPRAGEGWVPPWEYSRWMSTEPHWLQMEGGREPPPFPLPPVFLWLLRTTSKWSRHWPQSEDLITVSIQPFLGFVMQSELFLTVSLSTAQPLAHFVLYSDIRQFPDTSRLQWK